MPDTIWLTANFREAQASAVQTGQHAEFSVDGLDDRRFTVTVEQILMDLLPEPDPMPANALPESGHARRWEQWTALLLFALTMASCTQLPSLENRTVTHALPVHEAAATRLGQALLPAVQAHPGRSGVHALADAHDAFAARGLLAQSAERTLDIQYYIWNNDMTGTLLLEALLAAAERGVRVRLLLDDNGIAGLDADLAALDNHPRIEVRLFNPFTFRSFKALGYLTDFSRANRRMHNKSFTVDNQATIIGGRNIGDEYFGATDGVLFADLDVLAVGPVVQDVSRDFDRYWASGSSYPADRVLPPAAPGQLASLRSRGSAIRSTPAAGQYVSALRDAPFVRQLLQGELGMEWAPVRMISDDPAKGLREASEADMMRHGLGEAIGTPLAQVDLVSPYFVPAQEGTDTFVALAQRGVRIRVLTNSLSATDVAVVHSGYAKRRKALLRAGIVLYEMQRMTKDAGAREGGAAGPFGSSGSSLHAKTFAVDDSHVFIGSFNFDPRSARLNTELGFVIESPRLARQIGDAFAQGIPASSYEVRLSQDNKLYWLERRDGQVIRHNTEPATGFWKRTAVYFMSLLPIEWLL